MIILQYCKMQAVCLVVLSYMTFTLLAEGRGFDRLTGRKTFNPIFGLLCLLANVAVAFDLVTAVTVYYTATIPNHVQMGLHLCMFWAFDAFSAVLFWYWLTSAIGVPKKLWARIICFIPLLAIAVATAFCMADLEIVEGRYVSYASGSAVTACFTGIVVYLVMTIGALLFYRRRISSVMFRRIRNTMLYVVVITVLEGILPEFFGASVAVVLIVLCIFLGMENPAVKALVHYHHEMVTGFTNLVESRDSSTGGHVKRVSAYSLLIARNLRKNKKYRDVITKDFLQNLAMAAPMHDVGKVNTPDSILKKPGRLTADEYAVMKEHAAVGGQIIEESFGHLKNSDYESMAYQVAMQHHEKWNGKGYPDGIAGEAIPLCARIVAVADVFDAVSAKRCYREAMALEQCYNIIRSGRGTDFDPDVVDAFFMDLPAVEAILHND